MKKITIKLSDELVAEFNATVKRRQTTQKKAFEIMLRDWIHPVATAPVRRNDMIFGDVGSGDTRASFADTLPEFKPSVMARLFGWRRS